MKLGPSTLTLTKTDTILRLYVQIKWFFSADDAIKNKCKVPRSIVIVEQDLIMENIISTLSSNRFL